MTPIYKLKYLIPDKDTADLWETFQKVSSSPDESFGEPEEAWDRDYVGIESYSTD